MSESGPKILPQLEDWKARLVNLTQRNPLLRYRLTKRNNLEVFSPDIDAIFDRLVLKGNEWKFFLPPDKEKAGPIETQSTIDNSKAPSTTQALRILVPKSDELVCGIESRMDLEAILRNLRSKYLSEYNEHGLYVLFVAFGQLVWREVEYSKEELRSPLILVPVELKRESILDAYSITLAPTEEQVVINPALSAKLENDFKLGLPEISDEVDETSLENYFAEIETLVKPKDWKVERKVVVGLYKFEKFAIYHDLIDNAVAISRHPIIQALTGLKPTGLLLDGLPDEEKIDVLEKPEETFHVLDADGSQRVCIDYALKGQSFIMHGPPGTGKSQTIANIIAQCIAQGKSVLFVSEKVAALDVVYKRLSQVGLDRFCLMLHSKKATKKEVISELKKSLETEYRVKDIPTALQYERLQLTRSKLNAYSESLHKKRLPLGMTAYQIIGEVVKQRGSRYVPLEFPSVLSVTPSDLAKLEQIVQKLSSVWDVVEESNFPWKNLILTTYDTEVRTQTLELLNELLLHFQNAQNGALIISSALDITPPATLTDLEWLVGLGDTIRTSLRPEREWVLSPDLNELISEAKSNQQLSSSYEKSRSILLARYNESILVTSPDMGDQMEGLYSKLSATMCGQPGQHGLFANRVELEDFLKITSNLIPRCLTFLKQISEVAEFHLSNPNIEQIALVSEIFELSNNQDAPKYLSLLQDSSRTKITQLCNNITEGRKTVQKLEEELKQKYSNQVFSIDLAFLIKSLIESNSYKSWTSRRSANYGRVRDQIKHVSLTEEFSDSALDDFKKANQANEVRVQVDKDLSLLHQLIGEHYNDNRTDFTRLEKTLLLSKRIEGIALALQMTEKEKELLVSQIRPQPTHILTTSREIEDTIASWIRVRGELKSLIRPSLEKLTLPQLLEWSESSQLHLQQLTECLEPLIISIRVSSNGPSDYDEMQRDLGLLKQLRDTEHEFEQRDEDLRTKLGSRFNGIATDWAEITTVLEWTKYIQQKFNSHQISEKVIDAISLGIAEPKFDELSSNLLNISSLMKSLAGMFYGGLLFDEKPLNSFPSTVVVSRIREFIDRIDEIQIWLDFLNCQQLCFENDLSKFYTSIFSIRVSSNELRSVFRRSFFEDWLSALWNIEPSLSQFRREDHERTILEFRVVDQELIRLSAARIIEIANSRKPSGAVLQAADSQINVLRKQAAMARRQFPIRILFQKIPDLLLLLKPCILSNPLALSQFFTSDSIKFDVILFDEASQIVPEDAICALYRGQTIAVAGDSKQLPPTSFFESSESDDEDWDESSENEKEVFDSILDKFKGIGLPEKMLKWHYRSKHEDLIAFSNRNFYDGRLITFPSPSIENPDLGVKFDFVENGIYDRGGTRCNVEEAKRVADLVFQHFERNPGKTLIVVTFSLAQKEAIDEILEERRRKDQRFENQFSTEGTDNRLEGFDVKNLESVQGDERDVIIFSVGYGKDKLGRMSMNFGPLNKEGGERRLNVAITRAREKIVIVSSIKASDISIENARPGVLKLHDYLDYAVRGPSALGTSDVDTSSDYESAFEKDVAEEIQKLGYKVIPQVGCSGYRIDLGVLHPSRPGRFILAIECDGATYHSSYNARDRDRLRQFELEQQGWIVHRIWAPSWRSFRNIEINRVEQELERAVVLADNKDSILSNVDLNDANNQSSFVSPSRPNVETTQRKFSNVKIGIPYKRSKLKPKFNFRIVFSKDYIMLSNYWSEFKRLVRQLVDEEGPIHVELAAQRLSSVMELGRAGAPLKHALRLASRNCVEEGTIEIRGDFLWGVGRGLQVRYPDPKDEEATRRPIEYISSEEIQAAMLEIVDCALSLGKESLFQETSRLFGIMRISEQIKERMEFELKILVDNSRLVCDKDDVVRLSN